MAPCMQTDFRKRNFGKHQEIPGALILVHFVLKPPRNSRLEHGFVHSLVQILEEVFDAGHRAAHFHVDVALVFEEEVGAEGDHVLIRRRLPFVADYESRPPPVDRVLPSLRPSAHRMTHNKKIKTKKKFNALGRFAVGPWIVPFAPFLRIIHARGIAGVQVKIENLERCARECMS